MPVTIKSYNELKSHVEKLTSEISILKELNEQLKDRSMNFDESYDVLLD